MAFNFMFVSQGPSQLDNSAPSSRLSCNSGGIDNEGGARGREFLQMHRNSSHVSNVARSGALAEARIALSLCNFLAGKSKPVFRTQSLVP